MKIKLSLKIWIWIILLVFSLLSIINFQGVFQKGVMITSLDQNSSLFEQGLREGQIISAIDGEIVANIGDYSRIINGKFPADGEIKTTIKTNVGEYILFSSFAPDMIVKDIPMTNIKTGLDLSGGARALVQAKDHKLTKQEVDDLVNVVSNRFNVYGISDIIIKPVSDSPIGGNYFMQIEIAGASPKDLESLVSQQGEFEAKIGDETVFVGEKKDITSVVRSGQQAGIYQCEQTGEESFACEFRFGIFLSQEAAQRQADITRNLEVNSTAQGNYLSKTLDLYIDGTLLSSLQISEDLKGRAEPQIQISGSGSGVTKADAYDAAVKEMKKLQTILMTGSLPFKLEIVKLDTISPTLGGQFTRYILFAGLAAILLVAGIIFFRYRGKSAIAPLIVCTSEIIITLGIASFVRWDLDLPSIAGILAAIGTGIDDQIVILDETRQKEQLNLKQRIKRAFVIVLGAYFTVLVSLLPLWWAGAGLLKGFVFTTVIGITVGVLITRPAFADLVRVMEKE